MRRKNITCAAEGCRSRARNPFCEVHMTMLDITLRNRMMSAFLKLQAGRGADTLRIYSNMLVVCRAKIDEKSEEKKAAQGVLL